MFMLLQNASPVIFGESLLPVLFSPTEPKNRLMIHDLILEEQKKERGCAVNLLTTQPLLAYEINDFIPRMLFLVESQVNIHGTCHRASYHGVVAYTQEAHHLHVCGYR